MDVLEPSGDPEGGASDDLTGQTKSRLKSLKSPLFGKIKRKDGDGSMKQTQSESDITLGVKDSQHEQCSQGILESRAFSHDSIFLVEDRHSDPEPPRGLSHENIHGKVQALQMKLQQQKMHLGPPPLQLPIKHHGDIGPGLEEDGLPRISKSISNKVSSRPLSPRPISPVSSLVSPFAPGSGVDFSTPAQFTSLLNNSAARHRMSIRPKNQRSSAKNKRTVTSAENRPQLENINNLEHSLTEREVESLAKETPRIPSYSSKVLRTGGKQTASQMKTTHPVSPYMSMQGHEDSRHVPAESENERNLLSTSPQSPGLMELIQPESPMSITSHEATKETKCLPRSDEAQAAKPPSTVVSIDRKGKEELNSSRLPKNTQSNLVSILGARVETTQEPSIIQDEKKSNDVVIPDQMDTLSKCSVQNAGNVEHHHYFTQAPVSGISEVNLRPSSLRRNAPSKDDKCESKTLQKVMTVSTVGQEEHKTESTKWQRPLSGSFHLTVSSDKIQERPRTASFTGVVGQTGLRKEPPSHFKLPLTFDLKGQLSSQAEKTKQKTSCRVLSESQTKDRAPTHPVIPTKFTDIATNNFQSQDVEGNQDNEMQELGVEATEEEVQEGVDEAEEAGEDVTEDVEEGKEKETSNAFGVKLRSTSLSLKFRLDKAQSNIKVKQHSSEVSMLSPPLALRSDSTSFVEPENHHTNLDLKLNDPPLRTNESSTSTLRACQEKEGPAFLRQAEPPQVSLLTSKGTKRVPSLPKEAADLPPKEPTAVSSQENTTTSRSSEVSWMEMAREKTRSLQQLFTSRLPEFPGLQTTIRPTSLNTTQSQTQTLTSQVDARTTQDITSQQTQLPLRPTEATARHLPSAQPLGKSTHMQTSTTTSQPSAIQTCTIQTTTSQSQVDSTKDVLFQFKPQICNSTTKPTQSSVTCTSNIQSTTKTIYTAKPSHPQTPPIQLSSPLRAGPFPPSQTSSQSILCPTPSPAYPCLSSSPKMTSNLMPQQSANTVSKDQPQNEGVEAPTAAGKADRAGPQGKGTGLEDGRPMWATGLGNKTPLMQRWENQSTSAAKAGEQKDTTESRATAQSTAPLRPISKVSGTDTGIDPNASIPCVSMKTGDNEDKYQKKSPPPSPSSPLQSVHDSGQPSWMELAKRKSLAWSDKTMD